MSAQGDGRELDTMVVIAIQVVVAVALWGLVGMLIDLVAGTAQWFQFVGVMLGTIIALALAQRRASPSEQPAGDAHGG